MAKTEKNIVEEWAKQIKAVANRGYAYGGTGTVSTEVKNECFQRIIGYCEAISATVNCVEDEGYVDTEKY